jgi:hypothetical protein
VQCVATMKPALAAVDPAEGDPRVNLFFSALTPYEPVTDKSVDYRP